MEMTKSRPTGVSILAILLAIQGLSEVAYGLLMLLAAPGFVALAGDVTAVVRVSPWGFLLSGLLALTLAYGLWILKSWAFWATVLLELFNLLGGTLQLFTAYYPGAVLLSMIIPAVILIYFLADDHVREAFNPQWD
jgi:hypothetical protein